MYEVTFCRRGKYPRHNLKLKGTFTKKFETIDEIVKFLVSSNVYYISSNLTKEEDRILFRKYYSLSRKVEEGASL